MIFSLKGTKPRITKVQQSCWVYIKIKLDSTLQLFALKRALMLRTC